MSEHEAELRRAVLKLMGATVAVSDQARSMSDLELAACLLSGKWTTIEVHEAGRRLARKAAFTGEDPQADREKV